LLREGGRSAVVLPRGALSGSALARWRQQVLEEGSFADVCFLINTNKWIFEGVHGQYTVGLTVAERGGESIVRFAGPFGNEKDFIEHAADVAEVPTAEFVEWSSTAAFPLIPDPKSAEIFRLMKQQPRFDTARDGWEFRPFRELDATNDKKLLEFDVEEAKGRIPVYAGASFNLWDPDAGDPYAYSEPLFLRAHLENKLERAVRTARSAYYRVGFNNGELSLDRPRIAFRDIARSNDTRTTIAALIPPRTSATHKAPVLVRRRGDERSEAALLGIMASIPFDWFMRRWVELTMSYELLNASPVPSIDFTSRLGVRLVEIAGRLAAIDDRYAEWAADVGVP
ncbi:Eco57I restriction-modification methylase domain-containing protein, partial [Leucobacter chromiiresistens]